MFSPIFINGTTLNDAYFNALWQLWYHGKDYKITEGSFKGNFRREFDFCSGVIIHPHDRPLAPIMPNNIDPVTTDEAIDQYFANYLMNSKLEPNEEYRYSSWINGADNYYKYRYIQKEIKKENMFEESFEYNKETPIEWVIRHFQEKGYGNNHCYINIGNSDSNFAYDKKYNNEAERGTSPCLRGIDFKIKENKLITSVIFRSWDLYSGFPENLGGITLLNEYVAAQLPGVEPGPLAFTSMGLHCYDFQLKMVVMALQRDREQLIS